MSEKKITLKVTVKPNGDNGWRTVCNAYPQIVGEGRSCEDALASLVEKISEEFRAGTFKLDSKLVPAVSCQITEMKANLTLGTENYTLADFAEEAEPEEMHECESCGKECSCADCIKAGEDTCGEEPEICCHAGIADEIYEMKQNGEISGEKPHDSPCLHCEKYLQGCSGDKEAQRECKRYPMCEVCLHCHGIEYEGKHDKWDAWGVVCDMQKNKIHDVDDFSLDCIDFEYGTKPEAEPASTAESTA